MAELVVVLVEPKYSGNVGSVARAMMNFGRKELVMVKPPPMDDWGYQCAMHARDVMDSAVRLESFSELREHVDMLIGATGISTGHEKKHLRSTLSPDELREKVDKMEGRIGLVFGREDFGLLNDELKKCDLVVTIPTSKEYKIMNLSHAVAVLLYTLRDSALDKRAKIQKATELEKEKLFEYLGTLLDRVNFPECRREKTEVMFRRIIGRAVLTTWEYHRLMGIFDKTLLALAKGADAKWDGE